MDEPELDEVHMDEETAESLLDGRVAPEDAPQGYQDVARALHAAALMASQRPTEDADAAVAAFLAATPNRRTARMKKWKIAAATLAGGLTLSTGLAAADVLPDTAQDVASSALSRVGINVPDGDGSTNVSTVKKAKVEQTDEELSPTTTHPENHGSVVSDVAHDESNVGADHGAAVCATASQDKCKAGEEHPSGASSSQGNSGSNSSTSGSSNSSTNGATNSGGTSTNGSSNSSSTNSGSSSSSGGSSSSGSSSSSGGSSSSSGSTTGG